MTSAIYLISNLIQIIEAVFFLEQIAKPRFRFTITCVIWISGITAIYLLGQVMPLETDLQGNLRIILTVLSILTLYKDRHIKKIINIFLIIGLSQIIEYIALLIWSKISNISISEININENNIIFPLLMIADLLFMSFLILAIFYNRKDLWIKENFTQLGIMFLTVLVHFIAIIIYYSDMSVLDNVHNQFIQMFFQLLLYIILVFNYFNALRTRKLMESQQTLKNLETEMKHNYSYYTLADEKFTEISKLRHDILNQIQTVQYILGTEKNEREARQIMKRIEEQLAETKTVQFCQNPIINSVLTLKMNTVKASGIETDIVLNDCEALPFDNYDICSLFANLFDNAIEACQKLEDGKKRLITIRSGIKNDFFVLKITNSCNFISEVKNGKMPKSDKNSDEHGFGTKILESITKKYKGIFTMNYNDGFMTTIAALQCNRCDKK